MTKYQESREVTGMRMCWPTGYRLKGVVGLSVHHTACVEVIIRHNLPVSTLFLSPSFEMIQKHLHRWIGFILSPICSSSEWEHFYLFTYFFFLSLIEYAVLSTLSYILIIPTLYLFRTNYIGKCPVKSNSLELLQRAVKTTVAQREQALRTINRP